MGLTDLRRNQGRIWWLRPIHLALGKQRQEDRLQLEASVVHTARVQSWVFHSSLNNTHFY